MESLFGEEENTLGGFSDIGKILNSDNSTGLPEGIGELLDV